MKEACKASIYPNPVESVVVSAEIAESQLPNKAGVVLE